MFGWRGRIGLIIPSTNATCEMEFYRMVPEGVSVHTSRVFNPEIKTEDEKEAGMLQMNSQIDKALQELKSVRVDVIIYACTTASFIKGPGYNKEIDKKIKTETGITGISATTALIEALKALKLKKVVLVTPYNLKVGELEGKFFEKAISGFKVLKQKHLEILSAFEKGFLSPYDAYNSAREVDVSASQGFMISCTNFRTIEIINHLEADTGKLVVTSNQASMWMALKTLGISGRKGYGKLFEI